MIVNPTLTKGLIYAIIILHSTQSYLVENPRIRPSTRVKPWLFNSQPGNTMRIVIAITVSIAFHIALFAAILPLMALAIETGNIATSMSIVAS